ncbi:TorD/DmsD family molecular chaperone [Halodesulfurarchaeum formicicum]|uniref:Chaperone protein TorD n=1 Tax=Halodesulfurarchaeum formicicum TaxID=1873524 RepID=A0A1J1AAY6_9EURY|nr:molecular chaperone TorD family protein [Halodesulfurarchaeum formicicum]APE94960.1 chaperone protein TorD [Halodesulfurarchaeum formicicum]
MAATSPPTDPTSTPVDEQYAVLAACWRHPDEGVMDAIDAGLFADELPERPAGQALSVEYSRLFDGPGDHPCPPYESVYRDAEPDQEFGLVMGTSTGSVEEYYAAHGLTADAYAELPDHVAVELEFAGLLSAQDEAAFDDFAEEHLRTWLPSFTERVEEATREPFYAAVASATRELIRADSD